MNENFDKRILICIVNNLRALTFFFFIKTIIFYISQVFVKVKNIHGLEIRLGSPNFIRRAQFYFTLIIRLNSKKKAIKLYFSYKNVLIHLKQ